MATTDNANQHLIVTAFWEVNSGEEGAVAALLKDFLPQAQREPGVKEFQIHQNVTKPREFFFYEVFAGEAAFADHQQTDHFRRSQNSPNASASNSASSDNGRTPERRCKGAWLNSCPGRGRSAFWRCTAEPGPMQLPGSRLCVASFHAAPRPGHEWRHAATFERKRSTDARRSAA
ncbi:quinol monooxygenase YgiN [Bradyrhizobium sp. AZCC 2262]|uniref:putative quinol monooxygenase n=1 Tax=Bradyrhizobium sp. AZCC 2262 TaxID=3117022 RepID=UPI002FF0F86C